jgi:hypothetical protein
VMSSMQRALRLSRNCGAKLRAQARAPLPAQARVPSREERVVSEANHGVWGGGGGSGGGVVESVAPQSGCMGARGGAPKDGRGSWAGNRRSCTPGAAPGHRPDCRKVPLINRMQDEPM